MLIRVIERRASPRLWRSLAAVLITVVILQGEPSQVSAAVLTWVKSGGGTWHSPTYWMDPDSNYKIPTSEDVAIIDNGGNAAVRTTLCQALDLHLGNTTAGSGTIAWRAGSTADMRVWQHLYVGSSGRGTVLMTTDDAIGKTLTVDNYMYVGAAAGSQGTVTQDDGTVKVKNGCTSAAASAPRAPTRSKAVRWTSAAASAPPT